ncbi:hypothetical protein MesoLj131c_46980 [Mesorhizobium sp. 131-3-5]|uniref:hypothetical protein n=1 Tax=Mesorhizobium sp. 131-3-5 TaxID=2744520 RepID=UPI001926F166|nr:hypothetical protein [Mesorhizobium sp. 131-3-5]BCH10440.1 hypothetical protein MesoLj131c_46980 [Mesorhizobium sp. 131-3-5]
MVEITRRAALGAIASIPALGAATAAAPLPATTPPETPCERVTRLAKELATAMADWNADIGGQWKAHVYAAGSRDHPIEFESLDELTPAEIAQRHADRLAASLKGMHGGDWRTTVDHSHGFALVVQHREGVQS